MARTDDEIDPDQIDLEKVVWDPRYRRAVVERLNRDAPQQPPLAETSRRDQSG